VEIAPVPHQVASVWSRCDEGRRLLATLPEVIAALCERFAVAAIGPPWPGGWVGYVVPAVRADGTPAVLKLSLRDEEHVLEADALALWDGDGAVRLLDRVAEPNAMLLERCEPGTPLQAHPDRDAAVTIACGVLRRLERPLEDGHPFLPVAELAGRYADWIPAEFARLGRAFDPGLAAQATALCAAFADDTSAPVLVNRDFHLANVLAAQREPWLTIDPKPLAGPRAFDTGHLLRDVLPLALAPGIVARTVARLADELELAPADVRDWALVRSVENALWCLDDGDDPSWDLAVAAELARLT
jgi:streptomycin 6-kinase